MSQELLKSIVGTFLRTVTTGVGVWLVNRGYITESDYTELVSGVVLLAAAVVWSVIQKVKANKYIQVALSLPAGATEKELLEKASSDNVAPGPWLPVILLVGSAVTVSTQTACFKARIPEAKPAVYSAQSASALDGVQDTLIILYDAGVIKDKAVFAKHDKIATGLEVFYARIQAKGYNRNDAITAINQVIADVQQLDADLDLIKDQGAKTKLDQILFTLQFGLNSVKAVIESTKEPEPPTNTMARLRSPVSSPWWNDVILVIQNTALRMLAQSRMNTDQAWADTATILANIHAENQAKLVE